MAKIADYTYTRELSPEEAEDWMDVLVNDFGGVAESDESFAQSVGHKSAASGTFRRKIADARKYGLMTPRGTFEATNLGHQLANPKNDRKRHEAYHEMLRNLPLLTDIHEVVRGNVPEEFWRVLNEQTDANPKEAREAADDIRELYEKLIESERKLERFGEKEDEQVDEQPPDDDSDQTEKESSSPESELYIKVGNDELRFDELDDTNIRLVREFLASKMEDPNEGD